MEPENKEMEQLEKAILEQAGVPTNNFLQGVLMSIESNGYDQEVLIQAYDHWTNFYTNPDATNFSSIVCHLIKKADTDNLYRLSKGFPELVKVYVETQLLKDVPAEKIEQFQNQGSMTGRIEVTDTFTEVEVKE